MFSFRKRLSILLWFNRWNAIGLSIWPFIDGIAEYFHYWAFLGPPRAFFRRFFELCFLFLFYFINNTGLLGACRLAITLITLLICITNLEFFLINVIFLGLIVESHGFALASGYSFRSLWPELCFLREHFVRQLPNSLLMKDLVLVIHGTHFISISIDIISRLLLTRASNLHLMSSLIIRLRKLRHWVSLLAALSFFLSWINNR